MTTSWAITHNHLDGKPSKQWGPLHSPFMHRDEILNHPSRKRFRMRDADGELYYSGVLVGDDDMAPLDDFGMPNAGCTDIEVFEGGKWVKV